MFEQSSNYWAKIPAAYIRIEHTVTIILVKYNVALSEPSAVLFLGFGLKRYFGEMYSRN